MDKEHRVSVYDMVKELNLKEVTPEINSKEVYIEQAEINRPALQLAGFFENFAQNRVQIIGKAEHLFIEEVEKDVENAKNIYKRFIGAGIPVIVFCRNLHPSEMMIRVAKEYGVPVLISQDATSEFMAEVIRWLGTVLAPSITIHGVLVDVFGEGILITGESGIGKSEAALELIRRGHRLVSDDVVEIKRVSKKSLIGTSPEVTRFFIELRGIGIIDVKNLYGVESVKMEQEINLVIKLEEYDKETVLSYEKEVLGIYLSGHPLDRYRNIMEKMISARTIDFQPSDEDDREGGEPDESKVRDNQKVIIGGMITEKNVKYTKTNKVMAFLTVEDLVGTVEVMVFPRDYEKWQNMINEDARVFIQGRVSAEDDKASKLILEKVRPFSDIPRELWIQFESKDDYSQKEKGLLEDLRNSQGTDTVVIYLKDVKAMKKLSAAYHVNLQDEWLAQMSKKYGEGNVRVVERALKTL